MDSGSGPSAPFMDPRLGAEPQGNGLGMRPPSQKPAGWTPEREAVFRAWMNRRAAESGVSANADNPLHAYDYRALFNSGQGLSLDPSDNMLHGSSQFKAPQHPNRFVYEGGQWIDSITGQPVSPHEIINDSMAPRQLY